MEFGHLPRHIFVFFLFCSHKRLSDGLGAGSESSGVSQQFRELEIYSEPEHTHEGTSHDNNDNEEEIKGRETNRQCKVHHKTTYTTGRAFPLSSICAKEVMKYSKKWILSHYF
jgi:hypothetical protein